MGVQHAAMIFLHQFVDAAVQGDLAVIQQEWPRVHSDSMAGMLWLTNRIVEPDRPTSRMRPMHLR